mgnify:CR=1 FL=1
MLCACRESTCVTSAEFARTRALSLVADCSSQVSLPSSVCLNSHSIFAAMVSRVVKNVIRKSMRDALRRVSPSATVCAARFCYWQISLVAVLCLLAELSREREMLACWRRVWTQQSVCSISCSANRSNRRNSGQAINRLSTVCLLELALHCPDSCLLTQRLSSVLQALAAGQIRVRIERRRTLQGVRHSTIHQHQIPALRFRRQVSFDFS